MLKISSLGRVGHSVTLRLEGRVIGPWVAELRNSCEELLAQRRVLRLHLADVAFLDAEGVALLGELCARGVTLTDLPPFVAEQLRESASRV